MFSHTMKSISERNLFRKAPVRYRQAVAASAEPANGLISSQHTLDVETSLDVDISAKLSRLKDVIDDISKDDGQVRIHTSRSSTSKFSPRTTSKTPKVQVQPRLPDM